MKRQIEVVGGPLREVVFRMPLEDLYILQAAVREANQELEDWEFEIRMGVPRAAVCDLLEFLSREVDRVASEVETGGKQV